MSKFKVGQMVEILFCPEAIGWQKTLIGKIVTITHLNTFYYAPHGTYHMVDVFNPYTKEQIDIAEKYLRPINDPPAEKEATGDWNTITKLLGTDIRKEKEYV